MPLWAPWRMDFIKSPKDGECFLCGAAESDGSDDRERLVLARGRKSFVILNRYPYTNGHLLVAPYRHEGDFRAFSPDELCEIMRFLQLAAGIAREAMNAEGLNVGLNLGRVAGAGVEDHLHFHMVPRWSGDTNFMPVAGAVHVIPQSLDDLWNALRPRFDEGAPSIIERTGCEG